MTRMNALSAPRRRAVFSPLRTSGLPFVVNREASPGSPTVLNVRGARTVPVPAPRTVDSGPGRADLLGRGPDRLEVLGPAVAQEVLDADLDEQRPGDGGDGSVLGVEAGPGADQVLAPGDPVQAGPQPQRRPDGDGPVEVGLEAGRDAGPGHQGRDRAQALVEGGREEPA